MKIINNDEMTRQIARESDSVTLKIVLSALSVWIIYEIALSLIESTRINIVPVIVTLVILGLRMILIQQATKKLTSGDEEYTFPASTLKIILFVIIITGIIVSLGYLLLR
ncbi:hypothetical protein [Erysipelothrix anatis]|uniref:hypothetical protein n=1 Tax=Erysipelothrix anatis TaxID=2683713 RepID=UPI00140BADDA|nr:hypothetical protein [Erysipelothrix anatis]